VANPARKIDRGLTIILVAAHDAGLMPDFFAISVRGDPRMRRLRGLCL